MVLLMRGTGPLPERSPERRSAHRPARARWAALALALLAATASATAEDPGLETRVKAAYVYNFLTFVEREKPEPEPEGAPVRVCVLGDEALLAQLKGLSGRSVRGRPLEVLAEPEAGPPPSCRLLVIGRSEAARLPEILRTVSGTSVLTVSDIPRFSRRGGMIGFLTEGGRVRIEVNPDVAAAAGLRMSAKLLEVARVVAEEVR
ncbi:MAG TPA: YfiR family protein [Thermoanaerobaculia bacterium]|nr:YfiR family protein [Thermoanaerobaculia bacterium]